MSLLSIQTNEKCRNRSPTLHLASKDELMSSSEAAFTGPENDDKMGLFRNFLDGLRLVHAEVGTRMSLKEPEAGSLSLPRGSKSKAG